MGSLLKLFAGKAKQGVKNIAAGKAQANLGIQSPQLPNAIVRIGRFLYSLSAGWIAVSWYTGYVNERTQPGSGPTILGPGHPVIGSPDRPDKGGGSISDAISARHGGQGPTPTQSGPAGPTGLTGGTLAGKGGKNPYPGAVGSRLDQGFDFTSQHFNAPARVQIVFASASVPGWKGGGLVAFKILEGPKAGKVQYTAEGIKPAPGITVGRVIERGTPYALPVANPYNGIVGNVEAGWANPASPTQPLAQVSQNKAAVAWDFYNWIRSMGGPAASSTGNAGFP